MTTMTYRTAILAFSSAVVLAGCGDRDLSPVAPAPEGGSPARERLVAMGFRPESIADQGDMLVVEGDMLFRKTDLVRPGAARGIIGPRMQYHTTTLATQSQMATGLTVNLSAISSNSAWTTAVRNAMQQWRNTYDNKIWISETTGTADVTVSFVTTLSSASVAQGAMPINGSLGNVLYINQSYANSLSASQKLFVMVHELGHVLGFRHTNWQANGESSSPYGAVWVPGTPTGSESASVMTSTSGSFSGFTQNDLAAAAAMYPAPQAVYTAAGYDSADHPTFQWNPVANATSYRVGVQYMTEEWIFDPSFPEGGYWSHVWAAGPIGTTTGTSYTSTSWTRTGDSWCGLFFYVEPIYPSGKVGPAKSTPTFDVCWPQS